MIITIPRRKSIDCTLVTEVTLLVIVDVVIGRGFGADEDKTETRTICGFVFQSGYLNDARLVQFRLRNRSAFWRPV